MTAGGPRVPFGRGGARVERVNMWGVALTVLSQVLIGPVGFSPPAAAVIRALGG